eukprot:5207302-Lingulodinium_polyedra.AAC.1
MFAIVAQLEAEFAREWVCREHVLSFADVCRVRRLPGHVRGRRGFFLATVADDTAAAYAAPQQYALR